MAQNYQCVQVVLEIIVRGGFLCITYEKYLPHFEWDSCWGNYVVLDT